ncbi:hypothetical protein DICPUDRAFT_78740 [Dictyostelium purpureum]|uniref:Uncharacterized protein n=1 Tax=Dictyostelium purpureum TaxID=5786 RepID=F0ZKF1_DICPU|nr:uncharacterized protein DICPUDRAFT_78740 [Dictyostelium purpureum]EGC35582.1 hypothetical protein DICPUDRAFT_78740 [Dictyostelium purpureum]|eukprot:XP_003287885.1 hypothetical protein DICPUDRAFT_78740 [Dictyostelium purpureum]
MINNNNNNNNNNYYYNDNNEIHTYDESFSKLFYKVFHNKVLFNLIFYHIYTTDWDDSAIFSDSNYLKSRIAFKNIRSVDWIIKKGLFMLLKCKLEAGEFLEMKVYNLKWLQNLFVKDRELAKDLLRLLLKSTSIGNKDLLYSCVYLDEELLKVIFSDPLGNQNSILFLKEFLVQDNMNEISKFKYFLDLFFNNNDNNNSGSKTENNSLKRNRDCFELNDNSDNNNTTLSSSDNSIKNQQDNMAIQNFEILQEYYLKYNKQLDFDDVKYYRNKLSMFRLVTLDSDPYVCDRFIQLIFSNRKYYVLPPPPIPESSESPVFKFIKRINRLFSQSKINILQLIFGIVSIEIQNKILDLNYYYIPPQYSKYKDIIENIISNHNNDNRDNKRIIELVKFMKKKCVNYYKDFMKKYTKEKFLYNIDNFKLFLLNNKNDWRNIKTQLSNLQLKDPSLIDIEVLRYYSSLEDSKEYRFIKEFMKKVSTSFFSFKFLKDKENFCKLAQYVPNNKYASILSKIIEKTLEPSIGNEEIKLLIKDEETLDLIASIKSSFFGMGFDSKHFMFSHLSLINYAEINNVFQKLELNKAVQYPLRQALEKFDIYSMHSIFEKRIPNFLYIPYNESILNNSLSDNGVSYIIQQINYFSVSENPIGLYYYLDFLIASTSKSASASTLLNRVYLGHSGKYYEDKCEIFEMEQLKIFKTLVTVFIYSIRRLSKKRVDFLLNKLNFNPIVQDYTFFSGFFLSDFWKDNDFIKGIECQSYGFDLVLKINHGNYVFSTQDYHTSSPDDIIEIISLLLEHTKKQVPSNGSSSLPPCQVALTPAVNFLFKFLIQNKRDVPFEKIQYTYNMVNGSGVAEIQKSSLFSFFYLWNRSKKFIKYIFDLPFLNHEIPNISIPDNPEELYYGFNIRNFLDPEFFTFEFIFKSPFDDINDALLMRFMFQFFQEINIDNFFDPNALRIVNKLTNRSFCYLMDISRVDLLLGYIELLKEKCPYAFNYFQISYRFYKVLLDYADWGLMTLLIQEYPHLFATVMRKYQMVLFKYTDKSSNKEIHVPICTTNVFEPKIVSNIHPALFGKYSFLLKNYPDSFDGNKLDFKIFPIDLLKLLAQTYPNHPLLRLPKPEIKYLLKTECIPTLKQLYQNQLIDPRLTQYLKDLFLEYEYYEDFKWLTIN